MKLSPLVSGFCLLSLTLTSLVQAVPYRERAPQQRYVVPVGSQALYAAPSQRWAERRNHRHHHRHTDHSTADFRYEDEVITNAFEDNVLTNAYFPDTDPGTIEANAAAYLRTRGIIGGFPDGEFKGDRPVNRAELAKFLLLADDIDTEDYDDDGQFPDVKRGEWYVRYVLQAAQRGIIGGYPDRQFRPARTVNTAEFLKMLTKTFGLSENLDHTYDDVDSDDWFAAYAGVAAHYDLFPDRRDDELEPARELTRNEVAVALYQYLHHGNQDDDTYHSSAPDYPDYDRVHDAEQALHISKSPVQSKRLVDAGEGRIKALTLTFAAQEKNATITSLKFRRIGNGNARDFEEAWLEYDGDIVSDTVRIDDDIIELEFNDPLFIYRKRAKDITLRVTMADDAVSGHSSRWVLFLPEWIDATLEKVGFFPFGGTDIEVE